MKWKRIASELSFHREIADKDLGAFLIFVFALYEGLGISVHTFERSLNQKLAIAFGQRHGSGGKEAIRARLKKLSKKSQSYDELLQSLSELDDLRAVPDQLEARISEKRFLQAAVILVRSLKLANKPDMQDIGALADIRGYLVSQETVS